VIGTTLAHYRITAALGAGGMGEVWRATDTKLGRRADPWTFGVVLNWLTELERLAGDGGPR